MSKLQHLMTSGFKQDGIAWLETLVVSAIALYIWLQSGVPAVTGTTQSFFWPLLGPLLVALRYGFAKGFSCALIILAGLASMMSTQGNLALFPLSIAVGILLVAMLAGEFRDHWQAINNKRFVAHREMSRKLESFTQNYYLLKVSHDKLEQRAAGQAVSLRASISALHDIATLHSSNRLDKLGQPILHLLAEIGGLEIAGVYQIVNGHIDVEPRARLGDEHKLDLNDPMLQDMLEQRTLLSAAKTEAHQTHKSRYQLCIPMLDTQNVLQAVVVVENAKFFQQTLANHALLSLVASHAANLLSDTLVTPLLQPEEGDLFLKYLAQAKQSKLQFGVDSQLVVYTASSNHQKKRLDAIVNHRRGADIYWTCQSPTGEPSLFVLLPLSSINDAQQYIQRIEQLFGTSNSAPAVDIGIQGPFSIKKNFEEIKNLTYQYGVFDEGLAIHSNHHH
ncbi:PelD GGDEF domain-containing protein [Oceanisphaera sp. IT1-181]|uniref:PelD GGDEF domain-containing protein n=1 Tax=Oceanisphaera sp. IT1-181 TaxID=3081199 RepID=UPI0029CA524C|nr:PelD GGDEF domain-containing protein [Oceanisphaera sp. IT1-181]